MLQQLFRRKSVERILRESEREKMEAEHGGSLKRTLRAVDLAAFGIAAIIGAGIFSTVGQAAFAGGPHRCRQRRSRRRSSGRARETDRVARRH